MNSKYVKDVWLYDIFCGLQQIRRENSRIFFPKIAKERKFVNFLYKNRKREKIREFSSQKSQKRENS
jgi:hypothetical protein